MRLTCVHPHLSCTFHSVLLHRFCCAIHGTEPRQRDAPVVVDVPIGALVHALDQVLLVQQWVVSPECAGGIIETLIVVTEWRLPARRQKLVDVHHLTQWHHQDGACTDKRRFLLELEKMYIKNGLRKGHEGLGDQDVCEGWNASHCGADLTSNFPRSQANRENVYNASKCDRNQIFSFCSNATQTQFWSFHPMRHGS